MSTQTWVIIHIPALIKHAFSARTGGRTAGKEKARRRGGRSKVTRGSHLTPRVSGKYTQSIEANLAKKSKKSKTCAQLRVFLKAESESSLPKEEDDWPDVLY